MIAIFDIRKDTFLKLCAYLLVLSTISGFFGYVIVYYIVLGLLGVYFTLKKGKMTLGNAKIFVLLAVCLISLIVNAPPNFFRSWQRLAAFSIIILIVSPAIVNKSVDDCKYRLLYYILDLTVLLSVGSLFAYFLGINLYVRNGIEYDVTSSGQFSGLMNHPMYLGPFAALSADYLLIKVLQEKDSAVHRYFYVFLAVLCLLASLLAASRVGLAAGLAGGVFILYRYYKKELSKFWGGLLFLAAMGFAALPMMGEFTDSLERKQRTNEANGGTFYSREVKINARIAEFSSSPIIGVGFNVIDPSLDFVDYDNGQIEPGSSWLEILSMTGVVGFLVFLAISIDAFKRAWKLQNVFVSASLTGFLIFFLTHMLAEGWIYAAHNLMTILLWLIVAAIYSHTSYKRIKIS